MIIYHFLKLFALILDGENVALNFSFFVSTRETNAKEKELLASSANNLEGKKRLGSNPC